MKGVRIPPKDWRPDFEQLKKVLRKERPDRPVLFEFFMNDNVYREVAAEPFEHPDERVRHIVQFARIFEALGYDYCCTSVSPYWFPRGQADKKSSISLNDGYVITDRASFEAYPWDDPDNYDMEYLDEAEKHLPQGMKLVVSGNNGVLENVIGLVGYDNLCLLLYDDPELVGDIFEKVGSGLVRYYEKCLPYSAVGAILSNDDWGFNTQTMLSVQDLQKYVFPWQKQMCSLAHQHGKFCILHSCGKYDAIIDDIIDDMQFDARHSYEDAIRPVEEAYEELNPRIAVLGGLDINFMVNASEEAIFARAKGMLERAASRGGYALGTGNSVPDYIPNSHYYALLKAAFYDTLADYEKEYPPED